jgi:hypothetical protein
MIFTRFVLIAFIGLFCSVVFAKTVEHDIKYLLDEATYFLTSDPHKTTFCSGK